MGGLVVQAKTYKPKKCANPACGKEFQPWNSTQRVCHWQCALAYNRIQDEKALEKKRRKELREGKYRLKTLSDWLREAQVAFNAYIRKRDAGKPCISCGRYHTGQNHAGHYRTTKAAPEIRFHPWNCHLQCQPCNTHLSGNVTEYRINLVRRIGAEAVEWLEGPHASQHLRIEDAKEIKQYYRERLKEINNDD